MRRLLVPYCPLVGFFIRKQLAGGLITSTMLKLLATLAIYKWFSVRAEDEAAL